MQHDLWIAELDKRNIEIGELHNELTELTKKRDLCNQKLTEIYALLSARNHEKALDLIQGMREHTHSCKDMIRYLYRSLDRYGQHDSACRGGGESDAVCSCGFTDALRGSEMSFRHLEAEIMYRKVREDLEAAEAKLARIRQWTYEYGKALCPPMNQADTYGNGICAAKDQIKRILNAPE